MGKINKYSNLYNKEGKIIRKAPLKTVTIEELENMIDTYTGDKNSTEYANMVYSLMDLYRKYGNPHQDEIIENIKKAQKNKLTMKDIENAIESVKDQLEEDSKDGEYVEFKEVKDE